MIGLAGGDQLGRVVGVGGGDQIDIEPGVAEKALLAGDHQRRVVGVDEPVQQDGELVFGAGRQRRDETRRHHGGGNRPSARFFAMRNRMGDQSFSGFLSVPGQGAPRSASTAK